MGRQTKLYNSSITRVRPVFQQLIHNENMDWLSAILNLCNSDYAKSLASDTGAISKYSVQKRSFSDSTLKQREFDSTKLENCFEHPLSPATRFLEWLIKNPSLMSWPAGKQYGEKTESKRKQLLESDSATITEALKKLVQNEVKKPNRDWWVFEGYTEVDCLIETDKLVLAIEGKRTEKGPSKSTAWYPQRNQLVRNLESLKQHASNKDYALILIDEEGKYQLDESKFNLSLPHFSQDERKELSDHYLGNITWQQVCMATGISYSGLPDTVNDVLIN